MITFTRSNGKPVRDFRTTLENACVRTGVGTIVCACCCLPKAAGQRCNQCRTKQFKYKGLIFHDLRRTAAQNLRHAEIAEGLIMTIRGWKTRSVFERYAVVSRSDITDAIRKLQSSEKALEQAATRIGHEPVKFGSSKPTGATPSGVNYARLNGNAPTN